MLQKYSEKATSPKKQKKEETETKKDVDGGNETKPPILVWLDGTIIAISTILVNMYYSGMLGYNWWLCMVINVSVQYNGGLLPDIILLTQCYLHRGTRLNTMKKLSICSL